MAAAFRYEAIYSFDSTIYREGASTQRPWFSDFGLEFTALRSIFHGSDVSILLALWRRALRSFMASAFRYEAINSFDSTIYREGASTQRP
jgi:hypothetical protein